MYVINSSSRHRVMAAAGEESKEEGSGESSGSVSSKTDEDVKQPRGSKKKGAASVVTSVATNPTPQSGLRLKPFAAPTIPQREGNERRAGFRDQFLHKLREMLDTESQSDGNIVHWSTDGNSFIVTDQNQFEADIIPAYFENRIVFSSFLSKLYRWGFSRKTDKETGSYEFHSPTFRRLGFGGGTATTTAAAADTPSGASIQVLQLQQQTQASHLPQVLSLLQVMAQINQPSALNPLPSHPDTIAELISRIQCSQQPSVSSRQSVLNQNTNPSNNVDANACHSNQQTVPSPNSVPSQQVPNHTQLNLNLILPPLQPFQQVRYPNPTTNLLSTAISSLFGSQTPSPQLMGHSPVSHQANAIDAFTSLYRMSSLAGTSPNTNTAPAMPQLLQSLLVQGMQRIVEAERERSARANALHHAVISTIGHIVGRNNRSHDTEDSVAALGQPLGSTNDIIGVPAQRGIPPPSAGSLNFQADPIAALLYATGSEAGGRLEVDAPEIPIGPDHDDGDEGEDDHDGRPISPRKRKCPDDSYYDDDDDQDSSSCGGRLRSRKK